MNSCKFNMFGDGVGYQLSVAGHRINFDFLCLLYKFRNNHRILFGYVGSELQEVFKFLLLETTFIAAPERTYEGRMRTGNPISSTN
jgi:hypothetical protein